MKQFEEKYINIKSTLTCGLLLYLHSDKLRHLKCPLRIWEISQNQTHISVIYSLKSELKSGCEGFPKKVSQEQKH